MSGVLQNIDLPTPSPPGECVPPPPPLWCGGRTHSLGGKRCRPYSAGVLHSVSDQIQNLQNWYPPQTKMTSKDGIKVFVSLKVHKIEIFFGFDFEICIISLLVM